ncbi:ArsR family transcriptional regulator [Duganella violaceipulchra]|uniref:ArsR family transcriptional regulator n=1 Tax=Duganella violaceipulchra TaxID=2849652 RepID=A0AA41L4M4_9BURK|nr:ArsR family transcriptional regulator [Duganella violaceicalia]MBV6323109.1 ArsR family transcriptional regulator [Duganella violaceicalia]MCP2010105.1 DNA-binding IclR family transcriptional regulator [Duganella violaceicalia]
MDEEVMAALVGVLEALWRINAEWPDKPCTLAKLSKQSERPMSVLRRQLTMLVDAGWVELRLEEGGVAGAVLLTDSGRQLGRELFA